MATLNLVITVTDEHLARIQAAFRTRFGPALTNPEISELIRQNTIKELINFTRGIERDQARIAADNSVTPITPT